jgi:HSP20 family protein
MAVERWRPFGTLVERQDSVRDIQGEMNRLFDTFFGRPLATARATGNTVWTPVVDVYETKDDFVLTFELPGVREKEVSLSITGDFLTVRGERQFSQQRKDDTYHHMERAYGKFERTVQLPLPVQAGRVTASYRDGLLEVKLPKADEIKPKEIKIDIL